MPPTSEVNTVIRLIVHGAAGRMGARICSLSRDDSRFVLVGQIDQTADFSPANVDDGADVLIDFSSDQGAAAAAGIARRHGAALLVGTTGLSPQTLSVLEVAAKEIPVMVAANTSMGVAVLNHLVTSAARLLGDRYDISIVEVHHTRKLDAPSGTALRIAESLRRGSGRTVPAERIHAVRSGDVIGDHTVEFGGPGERLQLVHRATSRDLFALGALQAAAWLSTCGPGRYTIEQSLGLGTTA